MSSENVVLTAGVWVEIPSSLSLIIKHRTGGPVVYAVSDTEPAAFSSSVAIVSSSNAGTVTSIVNTGSKVWAQAISQAAVISYTPILDSSSAVISYPEIRGPVSSVMTQSFADIQTARGLRFSHKFDLVFSANATKYYLYDAPAGQGKIFEIQSRNFKSMDGKAQLEVLPLSTGYVDAVPVTDIRKSRRINGITEIEPVQIIYNLTDTVGNSEPTADGVISDTDFVIGGGSGANTFGGFSPDVGGFLVSGAKTVVKVTNLENSANRISLDYSWLEIDDTYIQ